jgi:hypothetical protein
MRPHGARYEGSSMTRLAEVLTTVLANFVFEVKNT